MTRPDLAILLSNPPTPAAGLELAQSIERCGYPRVWLAETNAVDAAALGGAIAAQTGLELGTAIVPAYSRSPALLAMMAATWAGLGGGDRPVHLGIGAGGQVIVERWHGTPFERPGTTVEDTLAILRQALAGERTDHDGVARHSQGFKLASGPVPSARLYVGGMGPRMRALAATAADGLIVTWISPRGLGQIGSDFREQAAASGREPGASRLVARAYVAIADDVAELREAVRREIVEYVVSPPYARYFRSVGFDEEVDAVGEAFARGDREGTARAVSDRLLDEMLVAGSADDVAATLAGYYDAGADELIVQPVAPARGGDPDRTVRELAAVMT